MEVKRITEIFDPSDVTWSPLYERCISSWIAIHSRLPVSGNHLKYHLVAFRFFYDNAVPMERIIKLIFAVAWEKIITFISSKDDSPNCPFSNYSFKSHSASTGTWDKLAYAPAGSAVGFSFRSPGSHYPPIDAQDPGPHLLRFGVAVTLFALSQSNFLSLPYSYCSFDNGSPEQYCK